MIYHAIRRASPKGPGQKFIGTCFQCGAQNLRPSAAQQECPNLRGLTEDEALVEAITRDKEARAALVAAGRAMGGNDGKI